LDPDFAVAYYNKGVALQHLKRYEEVEAQFAKARYLDPSIMT